MKPPNKNKIQEKGASVIVRPNPQDLVFAELNLEQVPQLWATKDDGNDRWARSKLTHADGSGHDVTMHISAHPEFGVPTVYTRKVLLAIKMLRQNAFREEVPSSKRIPCSENDLLRTLHPGKSMRQISGGRQRELLRRHLDVLTGSMIRVQGKWWSARDEESISVRSGFTLIDHYVFSEHQKFDEVQERSSGYIRLSDLLESNLALNYTAPIYLPEELGIRKPMASLLYAHLNRVMAYLDFYHRSIDALYAEDFPEQGRAYKAPSQRIRHLESQLRELEGKKLSSGRITEIGIAPMADGRKKLFVRKEPFERRVVIRSDQAGPEGSGKRKEHKRSSKQSKHSWRGVNDLSTPSQILWEDLKEVCGDFDNPSSTARYRKIVLAVDRGDLPFDRIRGFLKDIVMAESKVRNPAAVFNQNIKNLCEEMGVDLG